MKWMLAITVGLLIIGGFFLGRISKGADRFDDVEIARSYDDGEIVFVHRRLVGGSHYEVYWRGTDNTKIRLVVFSDLMPKAGRLSDGRIWVITFASVDGGDVNLKIQKPNGGWSAQHYSSEEDALIALASKLDQMKLVDE